MPTPKPAAAVTDLRQICQLGLPARSVMPQVLETLHRIVASSTSLFDWLDEDCRIVDYYTEGPYESDAAQLYFDEFYNRSEREPGGAFSERLRHADGVLAPWQPSRAFYASDYYNLIWRPRGVHHALEAVVRRHGRPVGALTLYRGPGERPFSRADARALDAVMPYLCRATADTATLDGAEPFASSGESGLVVADADGGLVYRSPQGRRLLYLARRSDADTPAQASAAEAPALPEDLAVWCRELLDGAAATPRQRTSAWGRFVFRPQRLEPPHDGKRLIAIEIERRLPVALDAVRAAQALPLSGRQRELCALIAVGLSYPQVARRMGLATSTAISYARVVYDKLGLAGREALMHRLAQRCESPQA